MFGQEGGMRTIPLGYENKKLEQYKEEMKRIRSCTVCDFAIAESGSYGELGYIVRTKFDERSVWCYEFTKLCPNCFGEVNALLRRIWKESKRKEDTHAKD